jgi:cephalosporin-C deacetylase
MPVFELPLSQLHAYKGRNPRPPDFDAFWDASIAEMKSVDPQVKLVPVKSSSCAAECFDLYFTGVGGSRIHAKYLRPKSSSQPHPAVLLFHGYTSNSGDWFDKFAWVSQGYSVAALDCRGQGGPSQDLGSVTGTTMRGQIIRGLEDPPQKLLFRQIFLDTAQLAQIVMQMPEVDPQRVGATGASQGGGLTVACAALEPRIKRAAPVFPFLCDYQRVWEMDLAVNSYEELRTYFRRFDPRHERQQEIFTKLGYIDCQHLAPRVRADVLMATGLMDQVCPPSTQFAAYNKITAKKDMVIYPDFAHETMPDLGDTIFEFMAGL